MILSLALAICPPQGIRYTCVSDGDTIVHNRERIRLEGIDTAELNGKCPYERALAIKARDKLLELLQGGYEVHRSGKDRYGRSLAKLTVNGRDVGALMVSQGYARQWTGRREGWCK